MGSITATAKSPVRAVALPAEHGGWGFTLEPILLGLLVAPSLPGMFLGIAAFCAFLARQPLKIALIDRRRGKRYARTTLAQRFALLYAGIAITGVLIAGVMKGPDVLLPLLVALPFVLVQLTYDARGESRALLPEIAGPLALGMVAVSIAVAGEWELVNALALWLIVATRTVPSILYVRARIRLERGRDNSLVPALAAHVIGLSILGVFVLGGLVPALALLTMIILLLRAAYNLSSYRPQVAVRMIGFQELGFGIVMVILAVAGYQLSF